MARYADQFFCVPGPCEAPWTRAAAVPGEPHRGPVVGLHHAKEISAMTTYDNRDRAERARAALEAYIEARGEAFENSSSEIADLIADLLHLTADLDEGLDPIDSTLRLARMHFEDERAEEGGPE
jgi:hypothetical protein